MPFCVCAYVCLLAHDEAKLFRPCPHGGYVALERQRDVVHRDAARRLLFKKFVLRLRPWHTLHLEAQLLRLKYGVDIVHDVALCVFVVNDDGVAPVRAGAHLLRYAKLHARRGRKLDLPPVLAPVHAQQAGLYQPEGYSRVAHLHGPFGVHGRVEAPRDLADGDGRFRRTQSAFAAPPL